MAQLTLTALRTKVLDYIPDVTLAKVGNAANEVLNRISQEQPEVHRTTFTTRAKTTTGTVSVTAASAAVTFSSAVLASTDSFMLVKIEGCDEWFVLTYASTTTGTLSSVWPSATDATATYTIVYPTVTFGSDVLHPVKIKQQNFTALKWGGDLPSDIAISDPGRPVYWSTFSTNTGATPDDSYRIMLSPPPDTAMTFQVAYVKRPSYYTVSDGATKSNLPNVWDQVLLYGTLFHVCMMDSSETKSNYYRGLYEMAYMKAMSTINASVVARLGGNGDDEDGVIYEERPFV